MGRNMCINQYIWKNQYMLYGCRANFGCNVVFHQDITHDIHVGNHTFELPEMHSCFFQYS